MEKLIILSGKARSGKDTAVEKIEKFYENKKCMTVSYAYYLKDYLKRMNRMTEEKPRKLMQEYGAFLKEKMGSTFLIDRVMDDVRVFSYDYDIVIITDARFQEEIEIPKKLFQNVTSIRIRRDNFDNGLTEEEQHDITEVALDYYDKFDYVIDNDETFEEKIRRCLHE